MTDTKTTSSAELMEYSAAGGMNDLDTYVGEIVPNEDRVLQSLGGDLAEYEKLMRDGQVESCLQQRRDAVIAREWEVTPGGDDQRDRDAADFLRKQLDNIKFDRKTRMMLSGVFYGYAVSECMWEMEDGKVILKDIKVRKAKRFLFDKDGNVRLRTMGNPDGVVMPERKFWTFSAGADDDDSPYGRGLAYYLYWPVYLKRNGAKFWAIYLDRFAAPTALAKYPADTADKAAKQTALEAAMAIRTRGAMAIPKGFELELLEALKSAGGDYEKFLLYWDGDIAKIILSQTGTTDAKPHVGTANVHSQIKLDIIKSDADLVCESFNDGPARWLTDWNFPGAAYPKVSRVIEDPEEVKSNIDRDEKLHEMGYEYTDDELRRRHGDGWKRKEVAASAPQHGSPASFAEAGDGDDVDVLTDQLDELAAQEMQDAIDVIKELVNDPTVTTLEELSERLLDAVPDLDLNGLATLMASAGALSTLQGMAAHDGD
jgi:phage gp29-like protein